VLNAKKGVLTVVLLIFISSSTNIPVITTISSPESVTGSTADLKIVVSLSMIGDWVEKIAGTGSDIVSIVTGLENPHTYTLDPSETAALSGCDLFIRFGLNGLEPWVQSVIDSSPSLQDKTLTLVNSSTGEYMEYDPLIESYNPHVWMSPIKVRDMCKKIYNKLVELDPGNQSAYLDNFLSYQNELFNLLNRMDNAKKTFRGQKVVVHHPAFIYFLDLLGINRIGAVEEQEGSEPSALHIAEIAETIKSAGGENVLLISQPQLDVEDLIGIAESTGSNIAYLTPLLGVEVETSLRSIYGDLIDQYIEMIDYNLYKLANPDLYNTTNANPNSVGGFEFANVLLTGIQFIMVMVIVDRKNKSSRKK